DDARAGGIGAAGQFLDGADQVVAVAGLFTHKLQQDELQLAGVEHPAAAAAPAFAVFGPGGAPEMTAAMAAVDEAFPVAMMMVVVVAVIGMAMSHRITPNCYRHTQDIS